MEMIHAIDNIVNEGLHIHITAPIRLMVISSPWLESMHGYVVCSLGKDIFIMSSSYVAWSMDVVGYNIGIITVRSGLEAGVPPQVASLQSDPHLQALVNHVLPMVTGPSGAALLQVARGRGRGGRGRGKSKSEYNFSAPQIDSGGVLGTVLHGLVWCYMALHGIAWHGMAAMA